MKTVWICVLVAGACLSVSAWDVKPGDDRRSVIAGLGAPMGDIQRGDEEILFYERGTVRLKTGLVMNADLISAEQEREQREAAERTRVLASQAQTPQPTQPAVYVQQPPQPQVVYVQQPAPTQVVYTVPQEQPQVVYDYQPASIVYSSPLGYVSPYCYGCCPRGYCAGGIMGGYISTHYVSSGFHVGNGFHGSGAYHGSGRVSGRGFYHR